ncbi:MAG: PAS domain-containing protein [Chitinophagaceae bacterium]
MKIAETFHNEMHRLEELYQLQLLDSLPEKEYDAITQLASIICGTPISLITLVDSTRQYFKSKQGLTVNETPREVAFCAHAILTPNNPFIVTDAREDERFADNPLVTGYPDIVFYAGIPLVTKLGNPLGTLCVIDTKPRSLTEQQLNALKALAMQVVQLFELRSASQQLASLNKSLEIKATRLQNILESTNVGTWVWNVQTGEVVFNERWAEIVGYSLEELSPININTWLQLAHPVDLEIANLKLKDCFEKRAEYYDVVCRMRHKNGEWVWVQSRGSVISWTEDGKPLWMFGIHSDITDKKLTEIQFQSVINNIPAAVFRYKIDALGNTQMMHLSKGSKEIWGLPNEAIMQDISLLRQIILQEDRARVRSSIDQSSATLEPWHCEWRITHPITNTIKWQKGIGMPHKNADGSIIADAIVLDITEQKEKENAIQEMNHRYKLVTKASFDAIWDWDLTTNQIFWGEGFEQLFGHHFNSNNQKTYTHWLSHVHPNDVKHVQSSIQAVIENINATTWQCEYRFKKIDGTYAEVVDKGIVIRNEENKVIRMVGAMQDVTTLSTALQRLAKSEKKYSSLFHLSPIPIWVYDVDTLRFLEVNKAAQQHYGYSKEEFLNMLITDIRPEEDLHLLQHAIESNHKHTRQYYHGVFRHIKKDGTIIYVDIQSQALEDEGANTRVVLARDITDQLAYTDAIEKQNAKLKDIAWIQSHIVRAPLARLMALVNYLSEFDPSISEENRQMLKHIFQSAQEFDTIIKDIAVKAEQIQLQATPSNNYTSEFTQAKSELE